MKTLINLNTPTVGNFISRAPLGRGFLVITLALGLVFPLAITARAVDPPPDGGYANGNTAEGDNALFSLTTGQFNTAIGADALYSNTTASYNSAIGYQTLYSNTSVIAGINGIRNTATGYQALYSNTMGSSNTANGFVSLYSNTTGLFNTALGAGALYSNTTGSDNTAVGDATLVNNTDGFENTAVGTVALVNNTTGTNNTAIGDDAMEGNENGNFNTATGYTALVDNISGSYNTAYGSDALAKNSSGSNNTAQGHNALRHNSTGSHNIAVGSESGFNLTTGDNNINIANEGVAGESNTIRIGTQGVQTRTHVAGIYGATVPNGVPVIVGVNGKLGTTQSSARFKDEIKPMDKASETILGLKPVTFHYKSDNTGTPQFGLIAEEVAKANPDLVVRDDKDQIYTVRYDAVNAMLLNEFLKEHRIVQEQVDKTEEQQATITEVKATLARQEAIIAQQQNDFQSAVAKQQKEIEALTIDLRKVSDQLQMSKAAPQIVSDNE